MNKKSKGNPRLRSLGPHTLSARRRGFKALVRVRLSVLVSSSIPKKEEPEGCSGSTILTVREGDSLARRCRRHRNRFGSATRGAVSAHIRSLANRQNLRQEPDAVTPHVRICGGGTQQCVSLLRPRRYERAR